MARWRLMDTFSSSSSSLSVLLLILSQFFHLFFNGVLGPEDGRNCTKVTLEACLRGRKNNWHNSFCQLWIIGRRLCKKRLFCIIPGGQKRKNVASLFCICRNKSKLQNPEPNLSRAGHFPKRLNIWLEFHTYSVENIGRKVNGKYRQVEFHTQPSIGWGRGLSFFHYIASRNLHSWMRLTGNKAKNGWKGRDRME